MAERIGSFPHLLVNGYVDNREFSRAGRGNFRVRPVENRAAHGQRVATELDAALAAQDARRAAYSNDELESLGAIVSIEGAPGFSLKLESFDRMSTHRTNRRAQWILLSVTPESEERSEVAQVWISDEYRATFLRIFEQYLNEDTPTGKPRNQPLVANIGHIRQALLVDLWQSSGEPDEIGEHWWEVWLRPESDAIALAGKFADAIGGTIAAKSLRLDNRHIVWIHCAWRDLTAMPASAVPVTEIRRSQVVDSVVDLTLAEQMEYASDIADRIASAGTDAPAVCILDTGVRRSHHLLADSLAESDMHTVFDGGTGDTNGHGTRMAGLALLGPLDPVLVATDPVNLLHRLESVKLHVPNSPTHAHEPMSYGVVTALATAAPEVAIDRRRVFCMAVTSSPDRAGEPSIWSAAVDALAAGTGVGSSESGIDLLGTPDDKAKRLFIVSAGNVREDFGADYLDVCDLSPVEDPGQAWNALVVGAHTELTSKPADLTYAGWDTLAEEGELSPHSRTGLLAGSAKKGWPIRPDICMEGGNILVDGHGDFHANHPSLSVQTTSHVDDLALSSANATSAATAQAGRLAARAMALYPDYWPETIRGLLPHAAEWTPAMTARVDNASSKTARAGMLRRYGWGVPTVETVERSARNAVTMVVQDQFVPFSGPEHKMREFRLHDLPWPVEQLAEIGESDVELRVTLSYFVEPSGSRRGWRRRYAYASHGLRFELRRPNETVEEFVKRVNREADQEEDGSRSGSGSDNWLVGSQQRNTGSLHQDIWSGYGAELAAAGGTLSVHAVGGWWKNNKRKDRVDLPIRYSLLVSLKTAEQTVDLYEPIAAEIGVPSAVVAIEI